MKPFTYPSSRVDISTELNSKSSYWPTKRAKRAILFIVKLSEFSLNRVSITSFEKAPFLPPKRGKWSPRSHTIIMQVKRLGRLVLFCCHLMQCSWGQWTESSSRVESVVLQYVETRSSSLSAAWAAVLVYHGETTFYGCHH